MASLIQLAAIEAQKKIVETSEALDGIMENMHDIMLYLDANLEKLPEKGEVSVTELASLIRKNVLASTQARENITEARKWVTGILEGK